MIVLNVKWLVLLQSRKQEANWSERTDAEQEAKFDEAETKEIKIEKIQEIFKDQHKFK